MSTEGQRSVASSTSNLLHRKDVLAGLMFIGVSVLGLWASRNYSIGTATRMGTGYVPRLLCWILLGLGILVMLQGLRDKSRGGRQNFRPAPAARSQGRRRAAGLQRRTPSATR